jgi:hypothetical protein
MQDSAHPIDPMPGRHDRFLKWPALVPLVGLCLFGFAAAFDRMAALLLGIFFGSALVLCLLVGVVLHGAASIRRNHVRRVLSLALFPVFLVALAAEPWLVLQPFVKAGVYGRLLLSLPLYEAAIAASREAPGQRTVVFDWDGFAGINTFLVYDETGQAALPPGRQSAEWLGRVPGECGRTLKPLIGCYYLCWD